MSEPRRLPLFAFGNVAHGVIAVGNVAHGVIAIGFSVSIGVIAIGLNAIGAVAIGLNAIGPISLSAINGFGVWGLAGVNLIAGAGRAGINLGGSPAFGFGAAALIAVLAELVVRSTPARPPPAEPEPVDLTTAAPGTYLLAATVIGDGDRWLLTDLDRPGDDRLEVELDDAARPAVRRLAARARRCWCEVRVVDHFAADGDYRHAPTTRRRLVVVSARRRDVPWLASSDDLLRLEARAFQVAAVAGAAAIALC